MESIVIEAEAENTGEREEILRNLKLLYGTVTGEQALDRDFGIDSSLTDASLAAVKPLLVAEFARKTERYEPRARVVRVDWVTDEANCGKIIPKVVVEIV